MSDLEKLLGQNWFLRTTEEFDGHKGGIWTTNEEPSEALGGNVLYGNGVHPILGELMDKHGWFAEPYDAGTLMMWPV